MLTIMLNHSPSTWAIDILITLAYLGFYVLDSLRAKFLRPRPFSVYHHGGFACGGCGLLVHRLVGIYLAMIKRITFIYK